LGRGVKFLGRVHAIIHSIIHSPKVLAYSFRLPSYMQAETATAWRVIACHPAIIQN
jgi:hypothetical protein